MAVLLQWSVTGAAGIDHFVIYRNEGHTSFMIGGATFLAFVNAGDRDYTDSTTIPGIMTTEGYTYAIVLVTMQGMTVQSNFKTVIY